MNKIVYKKFASALQKNCHVLRKMPTLFQSSAANFLPQYFSPQAVKTAQTEVKHLIPLN